MCQENAQNLAVFAVVYEVGDYLEKDTTGLMIN